MELTTGVCDCEECLGVFISWFGLGVVGEDLMEDFLGEIEDAPVAGSPARLCVGFGESSSLSSDYGGG